MRECPLTDAEAGRQAIFAGEPEMDAAVNPAGCRFFRRRGEAGKLRKTPGRKSEPVVKAILSVPKNWANTVAAAALKVLCPET